MKDTKPYDIAIVGAGPAGLNAAFILASQGGLRVVVLDQGDDYESRIRSYSLGGGDLLRGIGGAGTLAGGKLCGIPASMKLWRKTWYALPSFGDFLNTSPLSYGTKEILTPDTIRLTNAREVTVKGLFSKDYPSALLLKHEMHAFIRGLYSRAKLAGCTIKAQQSVTDVRPGKDYYTLQIGNGNREKISARKVIFATGRSSAGSVGTLLCRTRARVVPQAPDLGMRFSMPHSASDLFVNYGQDIKLKRTIADITARTFCVCTGGDSVPVDLDATTYIDGHFTDKLTKNVNVGIVARNSNIVGYHAAQLFAECMGKMLAGKHMTIPEFLNQLPRLSQNVAYGAFQGHIEATGDLLRNLVQLGGMTGNLNQCEIVGATIDRYWPLVETNNCFETHQAGLFVIGDAAGISRGYIQAMWSARCAANAIVKQMHDARHESSFANQSIWCLSKNVEHVAIAA